MAGIAATAPVRIHAVVRAEVLFGVRDKRERAATHRVLSTLKVVYPTPADFDHGYQLVHALSLAHAVGWADALIAATCIRLGSTIITRNDKHFKAIPALSVSRPY